MRALLLLVGCLALTSGCASLSLRETIDEESPTTANGPSAPTVTLEILSEGETKKGRVALTEAMSLQELLVKTGVAKKFYRLEIFVMRPRPNGEGWSRLRAEFQNHRVEPSTDYALHPGDYVIAKESSSSPLEDMFGAFGGSWTKAVSR